MQHWPSGIRDTTGFPSLDIDVSANLRPHLRAFTEFDGLGWADYATQSEASGLGVTNQRLRSYRKMYEKLGLIYKENDRIRLSSLGHAIKNMEIDLNHEKQRILSNARHTAITILSRYQLRNPADDNDVPLDCDVLPNICIWKTMVSLEGKLHSQEMNRVILRIMHMSDLGEAINRIAHARSVLGTYDDASEDALTTYLGEPVHTDQPEARIAPWFSLSGWGGLIISQNSDNEGYRNLKEESIPEIMAVLKNPPVFYEARDEEDWFRYYIGEAKMGQQQEDEPGGSESEHLETLVSSFNEDLQRAGLTYSIEFVRRFIASCLAKPFVIFTGLSGSGKTKLAQAFARWLSREHLPSDPFVEGTEIASDRITYYVSQSDSLSVEFGNSPDPNIATKVVLPRSLIMEWVACIKENKFTRDTPVREIRETVGRTTKYSTQLNSFETHLKAAAFAVINNKLDQRNEVNKTYEIVSVGPDWIGRDNILGYPDALDQNRYVRSQALDLILRANANQQVPHFLILDEMNLSQVERYFADILSALESNEPIYLHSDNKPRDNVPSYLESLPKNLFIIGTVNIDETTHMFSPKVLDRANVIEFTVSREDISSAFDNEINIDLASLEDRGRAFSHCFVRYVNTNTSLDSMISSQLKEELLTLYDLLSEFGMELGYRTLREITRYVYFHRLLTVEAWDFNNAIDAQVVQKILPRLHGSRRKLEPILCALAWFCYEERVWTETEDGLVLSNRKELLNSAFRSAALDKMDLHPLAIDETGTPRYALSNAYYSISYKKITKMLRQLDQNGFVSFAEA